MVAEPYTRANPIHTQELTGRWRPRLQKWTGQYIVQVELKVIRINLRSGYVVSTDLHWRDASTDDLIELVKKIEAFDHTPPAEVPSKVA